ARASPRITGTRPPQEPCTPTGWKSKDGARTMRHRAPRPALPVASLPFTRPPRLAPLALVAVLAAASACKRGEGTSSSTSAASGEAKQLRFAFVTNNSADFWIIAEKGVRKAEKDLGVKVDVFRPLKGEVAEQQRFLEDIL